MKTANTIPCMACAVRTAGGQYNGCHYSSCLRCNDTCSIAVSEAPCQCDRPEELADNSDYCANCGARLVETEYDRVPTSPEGVQTMAELITTTRGA